MRASSSWAVFLWSAVRYPKVRWALAALALAGTLDAGVTAFAWAPAWIRHGRLEGELRRAREEEREAVEAEKAAHRYGNLAGRVRALTTRWEAPVGQAEVIRSLDDLAARCGLKILSRDFDVSGDEPREASPAFRQTLVVSGPYASVRRFMVGMEDLPTLTVVRQVRMDRREEGAGGVQATFLISTFAQGDAS